MWVSSCSTRTASFPWVPNSGTMSTTRSAGSSRPSWIRIQAAAEVIALVLEKMQ